MVKVGIVGGTGYTGVELLRLLAQHRANLRRSGLAGAGDVPGQRRQSESA